LFSKGTPTSIPHPLPLLRQAQDKIGGKKRGRSILKKYTPAGEEGKPSPTRAPPAKRLPNPSKERVVEEMPAGDKKCPSLHLSSSFAKATVDRHESVCERERERDDLALSITIFL